MVKEIRGNDYLGDSSSEDKLLQRTNFKIIIEKLTKAQKSKKEGFFGFRRLLLI